MKTKKDFDKTKFDFSALRKATRVKVNKVGGETFTAVILDYWWQDDETADIVDAVIYKDDVMVGDEILHFPSPDIESVEILESQEEENHGSHPEIGFASKNIAEMYNNSDHN